VPRPRRKNSFVGSHAISPAAAITYAGTTLSDATALGLVVAPGDSDGDATSEPTEGVADAVADGSGVGETAVASDVA
jgi:hypothetical protein